MYYLDRQQDEKFHDWTHRVFNKYNQIRELLVKKHRFLFNYYLLKSPIGTTSNYFDDLDNAELKLKEDYPIMERIIENEVFPKSISKVKQYIENIKDYELSTKMNMIHL